MKSIKPLTLLIGVVWTSLTHCCQTPNNPNSFPLQRDITYRSATKTERLLLPKKRELTQFQYVAVTKKTQTIVARCCIDVDLKTKYLNTTHCSVDENFRSYNIHNTLITFAKNDLKNYVSMPEE